MNITILGTGTWGIALARALTIAGNSVVAWSKLPEEIKALRETYTHKNLPGMEIPRTVRFTDRMEEAMKDAEVVLIAVPSVFVRNTAAEMKTFLRKDQIVACVAKGLEQGSLFTMSEIIEDVIGLENPVVALSGPTHAEEVAKDLPTLIVSASKDEKSAGTVQKMFVGSCIRPYTNTDVKGVELCGAIKNIMALACGISNGLGYGDNTKAAIMTRGIAEMRRVGQAVGCDPETFAGLAGIGDLIVTATSEHSRNNRCGRLIGQGVPVDEAIKQIGMVVEGINALPGALELAHRYQVEMPITEAMGEIVIGKKNTKEVVDGLWNRNLRAE